MAILKVSYFAQCSFWLILCECAPEDLSTLLVDVDALYISGLKCLVTALVVKSVCQSGDWFCSLRSDSYHKVLE